VATSGCSLPARHVTIGWLDIFWPGACHELPSKSNGKFVGWAELNLVQDFGIPPKQNVHFLMTTGMIAQGQSALYVAETTSGKFSVYTMGADPAGQQAGLVIRKHDATTFRK
jgi:hypothetical protein